MLMRHAIIIEINACRNACLFCARNGRPKKVNPGVLSSVGKHALEQAVELRHHGIRDVEISGADPIEYSRLPGLIRILKYKLGFQKISLSTHGRNFSSPGYLREMASAGLSHLRIPLYGPTAAVHDAVTMSPGSFNETVLGLVNIHNHTPKISLILTSLLIRPNTLYAQKTFDLMALYADEIRFGLPCVPSRNFEKQHAVDLPDIRQAARKLLPLAEQFKGTAWLMDIPCCVIGTDHPRLVNHTPPPKTAGAYTIPGEYRSEVPFTPKYRIKQRLAICGRCRAAGSCDGFYQGYLRVWKTNTLAPIIAAGIS